MEVKHTPTGDIRVSTAQKETAYLVTGDEGQMLGYVVKRRYPSYRSDKTLSRYRYGFRGYATVWHFRLDKNDRDVFGGYTRQQATEALLREVLGPSDPVERMAWKTRTFGRHYGKGV